MQHPKTLQMGTAAGFAFSHATKIIKTKNQKLQTCFQEISESLASFKKVEVNEQTLKKYKSL